MLSWLASEGVLITNNILSRGKREWKNSCSDSTMEEKEPIHGGQGGVLAGRLAGHETLL